MNLCAPSNIKLNRAQSALIRNISSQSTMRLLNNAVSLDNDVAITAASQRIGTIDKVGQALAAANHAIRTGPTADHAILATPARHDITAGVSFPVVGTIAAKQCIVAGLAEQYIVR